MGRPLVYFVFDVLPPKSAGGLVAYYGNLARTLSDEVDFQLVSVFEYPPNDVDGFTGVPVHVLVHEPMDVEFPHVLLHPGAYGPRRFFGALKDAVVFFGSIPLARHRGRKLMTGGAVVAVSPAAAEFVSAKVPYLLELHNDYSYFWEGSPMGRMQVALDPEPLLTVFRSQADAEKAARAGVKADFIHNSALDPVGGTYADPALDQDRALFVGRLAPQKNPLRLLDFADATRAKVRGFRLDVYGSGPLEAEMREQIHARGLEDTVRLMGFRDDKLMYRDYGALWMSSDFEGLPLVMLEAMACGLPVVTTPWGDCVHEVIDGNGFVCDTSEEFARATAAVFEDNKGARALSRRSRARYEQGFSPDVFKERWLSLMHKAELPGF